MKGEKHGRIDFLLGNVIEILIKNPGTYEGILGLKVLG